MILTTDTGFTAEISATNRFLFVRVGPDGELFACTKRDAIELARALLISAGILPTPQAQGHDSYSLPPNNTMVMLGG